MNKYGVSKLIPALIVVLIVIFAVVALVSFGRAIFSGNAQPIAEVNVAREHLLNTKETAKVTMSVRGPIVADEVFHHYTITVTPSKRTIVTYEGYENRKVDSISFKNSLEAYKQFIHALDEADLLATRMLDESENSTVGICATGEVYEFHVYDDKKVQEYIWTSSCKSDKGSLKTSVRDIEDLFNKQIPDYRKIIKKVDL